MIIAENNKFVIHDQVEGNRMIVYIKKNFGNVWIYVDTNEVDGLIELLQQGKKHLEEAQHE